ncbi:unnamed protein product [Leptosia nina]|uniref:C2H2-type domain-containing protein n=1 Tax=Leptosia nina TaxID=320188 RepID=A0AAV1K0P8_9NEOP
MMSFFSLFLGLGREIKAIERKNPKRLFERSVNQNPQRRNAVLILKHSTAIPFKTRFNRIVCSYCHDELDSMEALRKHVNENHANADYNSAFYKVVDDLKIDITNFICNLCSESFDAVDRFMSHLSSSHGKSVNYDAPFGVLPYKQDGNGLWTCLECDKLFRDFPQINCHLRSHVKIFTCDKCGATFLSDHGLRQHEKNFKCYTATYKPRFGKALKHRSNTEIILKCSTALPFRIWGQNFNCMFCRVQAGNPNGLRAHMASRHANFEIGLVFNRRLNKEFLKVDITNLQCKLCFLHIESLDDLLSHLKNDHKQPINFDAQPGVLPFKLNDGSSWNCVLCKMQFTDFISLKKHTSEHYQNYVCDTCGEGFITEGALRAHKRIPHGNKYNCSRCVATFSTLEERRIHMKTQHTTMPYMCMHCKDKPRFATWELRKRHFMEVHNFKPGADAYECTTCHMTFKTRSQKYHHNVKSHRSKKDSDYGFPWQGTHENQSSTEHDEIEPSNKTEKKYQRSARSEARFKTKKNAASILECWTLTPFRWKKNHFKCAFCESIFNNCTDLREHVSLCSLHHSMKDIYSKFKEMPLINVDVTNAVCKLCACPYYSVPHMRQHVIEHGLKFDSKYPDGVLPFSLNKELWCCLICREKFNNFLKLYEHMNTHYQHYICANCGKGYMTAPRLRKHSEVHKEGLFPCDKCGRTFTMRAARDYHKANTHAKGPRYECPQCDMRFNRYYDRMKHLKDVHKVKEVEYECSHCDRSFKTSGQRSSHVRTVHIPQQRSFDCNLCEWHFKTPYELKRHMVKHSGERTFSCSVCGKSFPRSNALRSHLKTHDELCCKICGVTFKQKHGSANAISGDTGVTVYRKLKEHVSDRQMRRRRRANNELPEESERRIAKTMMQRNAITILECSTAWAFRWFRSAFYCSYCDSRFLEPEILRDHVHRNHLNQKPTKGVFSKLTENNMVKVEISDLHCRLCGVNSESIDALKEHLVSYHNKKLHLDYCDGVLPFKLSPNKYKCPKCSVDFLTFSKMNEHMNSHYRNYICDTCGKAFVSKSRFRTHVQSHEIGSFPCGLCDEVLETRAARTCHKSKIHHRGIRYRCPRCPEVFTKYYARVKHLVDKHGQQKIDYPCTNCGQKFDTSCKRAAHHRVTHKVGPEDIKENIKVAWKKKRSLREEKANAAAILEYSNAVPFRWLRGKLMCGTCPEICTNMQTMRLHARLHGKTDLFRNTGIRNCFPLRVDVTDLACTVCGKRVDSVPILKQHLTTIHNVKIDSNFSDGVVPLILTEKDFRCTLCGVLFKTFMLLNIHMNSHYSEYICPSCGRGYSAKHKLRSHMKIHEAGEFKCLKCDSVFTTYSLQKRHRSLVHGPKRRYRCPTCDESFKSHHSRTRHLDRVHGQKSEYPCNFCPAVLGPVDKQPTKLLWKQKRKFNDQRDNAAIILECSNACPFRWRRGCYTCAHCPTRFADFESIKEHSAEHLNKIEALKFARTFDYVKVEVTDLECNICHRKIPDLEALKDHLLVDHEKPIVKDFGLGVLPYLLMNKELICTKCGERFLQFTKLNTHMNQHYPNNICCHCGKAFSAAHRLKAHQVTHESHTRCTRCDKVFETRIQFNRHVYLNHKSEYRYRCPYCNEVFKTYSARLKHLKSSHEKKVEYPCNFCPRIFSMYNQRTRHIQQVHIKHRPFLCEQCPYKFGTAAQLRNHMVKHVGERKFQCEVCKKMYARMKTLKEHMRIHNNDKRFVCEFCNSGFVQKCSLKNHLRIHHPNEREKADDIKDEEIVPEYTSLIANDELVNRRLEGNARRAIFRKNIKVILSSCTAYPFKYRKGAYLCFFCKSSFLEPEKLREHSQKFHTDSLFKPRKYDSLKMDFSNTICKLCGVNIADYTELKSHVRNHGESIDCSFGESVLPYKLSKEEYCCQICGKRYEMFLSLHKHMNNHYEHYICETCGKGFATQQRMLNHSRTHEKGNFCCKHCTENLPSYAALYAHIAKIHKANKRYKCPICDEKFSSYNYRMKHLKTIHGEKTALFPCPSCPKVFDLCSRRTAHIRSQHLQERNHACTICGMKFFSNYELQEHNIKHGGARIYQCDVCESNDAASDEMETRKDNARNIKDLDAIKARKKNAILLLEHTTLCPFRWMKNLYLCFYCDQQFTDPAVLRHHNFIDHNCVKNADIKYAMSKLKRHELVKVDITDACCKMCHEPSPNLNKLKRHLVADHKKTLNDVSTHEVLPFKVTKDSFNCALCENKFDEFKTLNQHMNTHFQNFMCEQCGIGFITPERLRTHAFSHESGSFPCESCDKIFRSMNAKNEHFANVHKQVKRHRCPHCPEAFRNYFQKNKHIATIHGLKLKEFKCNVCPKVFTTSGKLGVHIRTVHLKMKRHACSLCEWKFYSKSELKEHMVRHGGERKYNCAVCKKAYARKYTLREHMRIHENDRRFVCSYCGGKETAIEAPAKRITPLFQVAYDRSLCKPLGTIIDFSKIRLKTNNLSSIGHDIRSRSLTPVSMDRSSPQLEEVSSVKRDAHIPKNQPGNRQNALTVFEFSTAYPFIYGNNKFKCFICSQPFLEISLLRAHMSSSHTFSPLKRLLNNKRENVLKVDVSQLTCKLCPMKPHDLVQLKYHLKHDHQKSVDPDLKDNMIPFKLDPDESYKCVICEESFIKVRLLVIHMNVHFNNYSCEICGTGFMTLRLLKTHLETHESGNYPCDRCDKVFSTSHKRSIHIRGVHLKQYPRRCPMCPERFNSNYRRTIHLQDVHNQSTRVHKCETCGRAFHLKYHLICHNRSVHLQERNHQCKVCTQRFCNKETLKRHMVIHTGEKNHKCDFCGLAFLRRKNLKDHLRSHDVV